MTLNERLKEIEARLEGATVPKDAFDVLYSMGYDSEKEPYCRLIAHAPTDLALLLALVKEYRAALEDLQKQFDWYANTFAGWEEREHEFGYWWRVEAPWQISEDLKRCEEMG